MTDLTIPHGPHFFSGLPRSASTLLGAILRQNPALYAGITSPLGSMVGALLSDMSAGNETSIFVDGSTRDVSVACEPPSATLAMDRRQPAPTCQSTRSRELYNA